MKQLDTAKEYGRKMASNAPFLALLVTIAILAITSAVYIFKYTSAKSYHQKWKDYDDCGLV